MLIFLFDLHTPYVFPGGDEPIGRRLCLSPGVKGAKRLEVRVIKSGERILRE